MRFSVVTPSFRSSSWLKLCIASVADQGVELEHIVQDSCSDDGTLDWLPSDHRVKAFVEKDTGMYDAINRGLRRASGDIVAYLNCDEQYLPGGVSAVLEHFDRHPEIDLLFGHCLVVDAQGQCLCCRKAILPFRPHVMVSHLATFTSSMFFRRKLLDRGLYFDTQWRALGDADWVLRALDAKVKMSILPFFASVFADSGANLSLSENGMREWQRMRDAAPAWARFLTRGLIIHHRFCRWMSGAYRQEPFDYAIYTQQSPERRVVHHVAQPTFVWRNRLSWVS